MRAGDELQLGRALSALRQLLDDDIELAHQAELLNEAEASDEAVAAFMAALPRDELVLLLTMSERPGVLAVWAHSLGRLFRRVVAENPWTSDQTLVLLAADYDEAVSAAAYAALVARASAQPSEGLPINDPRCG
jgi:hypothetical protein